MKMSLTILGIAVIVSAVMPEAIAQEPPTADSLLERAMTFDADGDGMLNRAELAKFIEELAARRPGDRRRRSGSAGRNMRSAAGSNSAETVKIGEKAPDWSGVVGVDDAKHGLADYSNAKAIALVFTCNHCPVAKAYEDRLVDLQKAYEKKDVQVVAVNVSNLPADRLDKMKERAKEKGFNFPYLYDSTQKIGRDYGARKTPEVYLLDQDRKLAYHGAIDDSMDATKVDVHHLRNSIDAVLAGKKPAKSEVQAMGCGIRYE
ncbi:Thiol-disulfide oxidoreductase ResA [Adhaeretor mobilis]|uniref:Thiol-disulfide oxidoreductase ResA n=2 Tax=Adhaeretor mobilis TaxID=1930276 RepID=A0A517MXG7_9BACT|nr:Thiol-disulfide oxidoreductase ResA [Adhaeretor mobilis]